MDNKENFLGFDATRKFPTLQLTQKTTRSHSVLHELPTDENFKKTAGSLKNQHSPKSEDKKKSSTSFILSKKPNTASSNFRKKDTKRGRSLSPLTSKSFSLPYRHLIYDGGSIGSSSSAPQSVLTKDLKQGLNKIKPKNVTKVKIDLPEDFERTSLLTLAVEELGITIETWRTTMNELPTLFREPKPNPNFYKYESVPANCAEKSSFLGFENSCGETLEEIFQVWLHLIYFIINLKINIVRVMMAAEVEPFKQNVGIERDIIVQAIECAKLFSLLKMKSLVNSLENNCMNEQTQAQFSDYEKRVSSPFLFEMDFIHKKAQEILKK